MLIDAQQIASLADALAAHRGLKLSTISSYAANDGKLFGHFKRGAAGCTLRRAKILALWLSDNWPADLAWPCDIPRPAKPKKEAA